MLSIFSKMLDFLIVSSLFLLLYLFYHIEKIKYREKVVFISTWAYLEKDAYAVIGGFDNENNED